MDKAQCLVFVYGTLMRGQRNHPVMEAAGGAFVGEAETAPGFGLAGGGSYPTMYRMASPGVVLGEVFAVPLDGIPGLDALEGHPNFFRRESITVRLLGRTKVDVDAYLRPMDALLDHPALPHGDWRRTQAAMTKRM